VNVTPFDLAACPHVTAGAARATRVALPILASWPRRWALDLPAIGLARLAIAGVGRADLGRHAVEFEVLLGVEPGRLTIDPVLAVGLVDAALAGPRVLSTPRAFGPAERGVLVGLIGGAFASLGWTIRLDSVPRAVPDAVSILLNLESSPASGSLRLDVSPIAVGLARPTQAWRDRAARLPVPVRIELATTRLTAPEVAGLELGDAVVLDGVSAAAGAPDRAWEGRLVVRGDKDRYFAPIDIGADGTLTLKDGFSVLDEEGDMDAPGSGSSIDATTVIGAAPIEVIVELGRITLRGEELLGLAPGTVLSLGAQRQAVSLRVGGERWAEGEMVNVDGELGVRLTRLVNR
jgi:type III secretion system YscQ/HrcQ family protein